MSKKLLFLAIPFLLFGTEYKKVYINNVIPTNLQCPDSHSSKCSSKYFKNIKNIIFKFYMCGKHKRSELRFLDEFKFNKNIERTLEADIKINKVNKGFTVLQIHTNKGINKPILRIATYNNRIKLFVFNGKKYIKHTVMKFKKISNIKGKKLHVKVKVKNNMLYVYTKIKNINDTFKTKIYDKKDYVYFKIGNYLQKNGCSKVIIYNIKYY